MQDKRAQHTKPSEIPDEVEQEASDNLFWIIGTIS